MQITKNSIIGDVLDFAPATAQFFFEIGIADVCGEFFPVVEHSQADGSTELFGIFGSHVHLNRGVLVELRVITELASLAMGDVETQIGYSLLNQGSRLEDFQFVVEEAGEVNSGQLHHIG